MKQSILYLFFIVFFLHKTLLPDDKVYTLANSSDYGIVVDENAWTVKKGIVSVNYHTRDLSAIKGESVVLPMDFEFFSFFVPIRFTYAKNYLEIYAFNTKGVYNVSNMKEDCSSYLVGGTFFDNISSGYFEFSVVGDRRNNGRVFAMMTKLRFDLVKDEDTRKGLFEEVRSMITPLVNY